MEARAAELAEPAPELCTCGAMQMRASADEVRQCLQLSKCTEGRTMLQAAVFGHEVNDLSWDIDHACPERVYGRAESDGP